MHNAKWYQGGASIGITSPRVVRRMTESGFSPPQAVGLQPRRLGVAGFSHKSCCPTDLESHCWNTQV
jgi:hypothetical protein